MAEFIGLFIPKDILSIKELNLTEKCLLMQIIPLCVSEPCYASNGHFSERIGVTETTISTTLKSLDDKGYIQTFLDRKQGNKRTIEIFYFEDTLFKNFKDPSLKTLNTLFKNLKYPLKNSYIPYLKNLKTLFKNLNFIYKEESKEESKDYSKDENKDEIKEENEFSKNENPSPPQDEIVFSESDNLVPKKEKKENAPQAGGAVEKKVWGEWVDGQGDGELHQLLANYFLNPNSPKYETNEYRKFKAYWTAIVLVGNGKGKELWRTKQTFSISGRLSTWNGKATTFNQNKNHGTTSQLPNSRSKNNWNAEQVALDAIAIATAHLN